MILSRARCSMLVALSCCAWLAACGDPAPEPDPGAAATTKPAPKATDPGVNMVAAVSAGKTSRAVGVHFSLGNAPTVKTALPVDIAIIPHEPFITLSARFESPEGLTMISGDQLAPAKNAGAEKVVKHQLTLMPERNGVFIVTASVETEGAEGTVTRVFSIPVIVETSAASSAPETPAAAPAEKGSAPDS